MADITPVTREEFYLAKAGGQDVPVPSAVTREEYYLEKLTNDSVVVPLPVTRREKFLYFACGGEIDLPREEKMTRLERLIAKAGGMDVSTPTAVTRLEKFWANVEAGGWKTITGVLPLTFTAKAGAADTWTIYGNDDVGENLINVADITIPANVADERGIKYLFNNLYLDVGTYTICCYQENTLTSNTRNALSVIHSGGTHEYESISTNFHLDNGWHTLTFTLAQAGAVSAYAWGHTLSNDCVYTSCMLVKGSTPPDHYIPYQQGVGERTENLFDIPNITATGYNNYYAVYSFSGTLATTILTEINANIGSQYSWYINIDTEYTGNVFFMLVLFYADGTYDAFINPHNFTPAKEVAKVEIRAAYDSKNGNGYQYTFSDITLVKGSTPPETYIPYGYQVPLTVSQDGQTDKNYDIYIGADPLTEGETVSKTSTGQDIELFEGENTVSTTLYNKPTMEIKYK